MHQTLAELARRKVPVEDVLEQYRALLAGLKWVPPGVPELERLCLIYLLTVLNRTKPGSLSNVNHEWA